MYFLVFLALEILLFVIIKRSSVLLLKKEIFPTISKELIAKYNAFDSRLGWTNRAGSVKSEVSQGKKIEYTYNDDGSRGCRDLDNLPILISTWGDSYCQCREVDDTGTWQYFLSKRLNKGISNFGVGNYGADQALLRLRQEFSLNPTEYVVLAFTPYTITRITSVWKHFSEFGNILAFKPRFIVEDKGLRLVPNIIQKREMLSNREDYIDHVSQYDEHADYIKKHSYHFPFTISALLKHKPLIRELYQKTSSALLRIRKIRWAISFSDKFYRDEIEYRKRLYAERSDLLQLIVDDFASFAQDNKCKPILLLLPAIEDVRYCKKSTDRYYANITTSKELEILDFMDVLSEEGVPSDYFVDSIWGGHYSEFGNQKLADFLEKKLHEINIEI